MSCERLQSGPIICTLLVLVFVLPAVGQQLQEFSYVQDFETEDPVQFLASDGEHEVHFKGFSEDQAFSGKKSFKLDVTIKSGHYLYWSIPVRVPCEGALSFSGRLLIAEPSSLRAGLGVSVVFPPTTHSGCGAFAQFSGPTDGWKLIEGNIVTWGQNSAGRITDRLVYGATEKDIGIYLSQVGIFLYGTGRIVLYVDDVHVEGQVPSEAAYEVDIKQRWQDFSDKWHRQVADWRQQMSEAEEAFASLPKVTDEGLLRVKSVIHDLLTTTQEQLAGMEGRGYISPWGASRLEENMGAIKQFPSLFQMMIEAIEVGRPLVTYSLRPITNVQALPNSFPHVPGTPGGELSVSGCRGEYEPATFAVYTLDDLSQLIAGATDLAGPGGVIPSGVVDIRVVKCWYQAGREIWEVIGRTGIDSKQLAPELLLKDDALVQVDSEEQANYLRSTAEDGTTSYLLASGEDSTQLEGVRPIDAETLQPVNILTDTLKQFWVTVHIPEDATPGTYTGAVRLSAPGIAPVRIPLTVTVHPFDLAEPDMIFSIYYRAKLAQDNQPTITSEWRSEEQYLAELRDLHAHGVQHPNLYQGYDPELLPRALQLRQQAGLTNDIFFTLGFGTGDATSEEALNALKNNVKRWINLAAQFGYKEVYFYGIDEATGEKLKSQRPAWEATHQAGGKTFVACYTGAFELIGDLLDVAVLGGPPLAKEAEKYHGVGAKIFCYGNPQVGVEEPETYRRNYGLLLWKAGYDGAMDYAYQHGFDHVWNDFDSKSYRDHCFTYPTVNGIVGTIQWEGFREAVDDVRYVTTLEQAIAKAGDTEAARAAQRWLDRLDPSGDLDQIRERTVKWIKRLTR